MKVTISEKKYISRYAAQHKNSPMVTLILEEIPPVSL